MANEQGEPRQPTRPAGPRRRGRASTGDGFTIQRVEGGFFLVIESSEHVDPPSAPDGSPVVALIPAAAREQLTKITHQRRVVAKSVHEITALLREWAEGSTS